MSTTVGLRIEEIARSKGLPTGAALAAKLGVSYETLRRWRADGLAPNRARQRIIADYLGVDAAVFMFGSDGSTAGEPLTKDEARLLRAYRKLLTKDRAELLAQAERRAHEIDEIEARVRAEQHVRSKPRLARAA